MFTYDEAVNYIEDIPKFTTKNKLEHTRKCLDMLDSPDKDRKLFMLQEQTEREVSVLFFLPCWKPMVFDAGYSHLLIL